MAAVPILTYHSIDPSGSVVSVAPALFSAQMAHLAAEGWQTLTLAEAVGTLARGEPLPDRHTVLTFDDAYLNVHAEAFPVLQKHGFRATVFAISGWMGRTNAWPGHHPPMGVLPLMGWEAARELHRHGFEIGAHTHTHPDLRRLPLPSVREEIARSKGEIEHRLGAPVQTFAYPYGAVSPGAVALAREHFEGACTTRLGRVQPGAPLHLLARIDVYYVHRPRLFLGVPGPLIDRYLTARQGLRDLRSRWT